MYSLSDYDYDLPPELIAQQPARERDASRLLCLDRPSGRILHRRFSDIVDLLCSDDLLVVNNTAVVPARIFGRKETGGKVEVLILDYPALGQGCGETDCLVRTSKPLRPGLQLFFKEGLQGEILSVTEGVCRIRFCGASDIPALVERIGQVPLPPYIRRGPGPSSADDRNAYQTVYALEKGAVAAPTAGLHFTRATLDRLREKGVRVVEITLHVGYGTFFPVKTDDIRDHRIHAEWFRIDKDAADTVNRHKSRGGRVVAVGTTCVRTLEHVSNPSGKLAPSSGWCDLFIYPGYGFRTVGAMITNFHLPRSSLLMLVSAFAGRETILGAYREAVEKGYRFYSYGDAMFIT